jgi:hypothetical protein
LSDRLTDAQVEQVVSEMWPHQELGRQVANRPHLLGGVEGGRADPAVQQKIPHEMGQRHVVVMLGGQCGELALDIEQVVEKGPLDVLLAHPIVARLRRRWRFRGVRRALLGWLGLIDDRVHQ